MQQLNDNKGIFSLDKNIVKIVRAAVLRYNYKFRSTSFILLKGECFFWKIILQRFRRDFYFY